MRPLSAAFKRALFEQETAELVLALLTITDVGLDGPLRFVNDVQDLDSREDDPLHPAAPGVPRTGEIRHFLGCPFQISLPDETDRPPQALLVIDNVAQEIVAAVRSLAEPPTITLEVVLASNPDLLEAGPFVLTLRAATYDAQVISGTLMFEDSINETFPQHTYTPGTTPALF